MLASFAVGQIVPGAYRSYGRFVIDTFLNRQDEILALLSDGDMRRIGVEIGVIPRVYYPMPINMHYELSGFCASAMDLPLTPTFTSEGGYKIWIIRAP